MNNELILITMRKYFYHKIEITFVKIKNYYTSCKNTVLNSTGAQVM